MTIEAVNSTLATSAVTRTVAEQQSSARSFAANPDRVQEIARAPYVSPYISVDTQYDRAVLQIRDSDTGDVLNQYPSESQLQAYRRAQQAQLSQQPIRNVEQSIAQATGRDNVPSETQTVQQSAQQQVSAPVTEAVTVDTQA